MSGSALANNNKAYEERVKIPTQRDSLDETAMKVSLTRPHPFFCHSTLVSSNVIFRCLQRFGDNVGQLLDPNHASMLKSAGASGQPAGCCSHTYMPSLFLYLSNKNHSISLTCANFIC